MNYNTKQQAFIDCPATRIILHAGPGSGKSASLIGRIKADQARGIKPASQVCITYTVAAAENLVDRMGGSPPAFVGTIHGYCLKLVRQHWKELGYSQAPSVLDEDESKKELADIAERIGCKNGFEDWRGQELGKTAAQIAARQHLRLLRKRGLCDFVTMQHEALRLIERGVIAPLGALYVDEANDCTALETAIYDTIEAGIKAMCGDEDQSIFGWREGSMPGSAMAGLEGDTHLDLDINHRSDHRIIVTANRIIRHFRHYRSVERLNVPHTAAGEGFVDTFTAGSIMERNQHALTLAATNLCRDESVAILCRYNADVDMLRAMCSPELQALLPQQRDPKASKDYRIARRVLEFLAGGEECEITARCATLRTCKPATAIRHIPRLTNRQIRICDYALSKTNGDRRDALSAYLAMVEQEQEAGKFYIGTIHSAKGKEWDSVIVCGCEEATWEGKRDSDEDELRRLFYVASTRAKHNLWYVSAEHTAAGEKTRQSKFVLEATGEV